MYGQKLLELKHNSSTCKANYTLVYAFLLFTHLLHSNMYRARIVYGFFLNSYFWYLFTLYRLMHVQYKYVSI